jgi:uncharacterized protein
MPQGNPIWIDLLTSDPERSRHFYTQLLGWTADSPDAQHGGYFTFRKDGGRVAGGMGKQPGMAQPDAWSVYLHSADARKTADEARARGATVIIEPETVEDLGVMSVILDPGGAGVGIWQPITHTGFEVSSGVNSPTWFELHTSRYDDALDFYRQVFGWNTVTMSDEPSFRYTIVQDGEHRIAGVMDNTAFGGGQSYWLVYFGVADCDAAAGRAVELGATVQREPEDTPYGRLAAISDPTGARFNLMAPNAAMPFDTTSRDVTAKA